MKIRPTEFEQLISDYFKDQTYIKSMKFKWLTPKEKLMRKLPKASEIKAMEESPIKKVMRAVTAHAINPKRKKVSKTTASKGERQEPGERADKLTESAKGQRVYKK